MCGRRVSGSGDAVVLVTRKKGTTNQEMIVRERRGTC